MESDYDRRAGGRNDWVCHGYKRFSIVLWVDNRLLRFFVPGVTHVQGLGNIHPMQADREQGIVGKFYLFLETLV